MEQQLECVQLESERLVLQPIAPDSSSIPSATGGSGTTSYWKSAAQMETAKTDFCWLLQPRLAMQPVGYVALTQLEERHHGKLSYGLDNLWQGMGLLPEVLGLVKEFALNGAGFHWIEANVSRDNPAACRLLEHLGLRLEGPLSDGILTYSLFRSEEEIFQMEEDSVSPDRTETGA